MTSKEKQSLLAAMDKHKAQDKEIAMVQLRNGEITVKQANAISRKAGRYNQERNKELKSFIKKIKSNP
ncbi:MAG: hypothetical protein EHM20_00685 [Alphaproteobacteria bacterium]|nr:MAG: hypothetical protein EHM20_00685 [Alphaproteobacteria bacterium]